MARILVTGGAGFIGSNLTDRLLAEGHEVTVLDDLSTGSLVNLQPARRDPALALRFVRLDLTSDALDGAVARARPEVVVHLAAQVDVRASVRDPVADALANVVGTVNLLQACARRDVGKVVNVSSGGAIYGEAPAEALPLAEDHPPQPRSPYAAGKLAAELYLPMFESLHGLRWTTLALANVYGPRQDAGGEAGVVALFADAMLRDGEVTIYGDGQQTRDLVYVADVVDALVAALDAGDGRRLNIGTGSETSVAELCSLMADLTGYGRAPRYAPARPGELARSALDASAAGEVLGWKPRTALREGVASTIDWIQARRPAG